MFKKLLRSFISTGLLIIAGFAGKAQTSVQSEATDSLLFYSAGNKLITLSPLGQMRIGNAGPINANAILQLNSNTKGLLLPRVPSATISAMTGVPAGMILFNTTTNRYMIFDGTSWESLLTSAGTGAAWQTDGNTGTTAANFIGTTDNISLRFKTADTLRLIIDSLGRIGMGVNQPTAKLDIQRVFSGKGISSVVNSNGNANIGVYSSTANGDINISLMGESSSSVSADTAYGVMGKITLSNGGIGAGVTGYTTSAGAATGNSVGVQGIAKGGNTALKAGVYGVAENSSGDIANTYGAMFEARAQRGTANYGIYATSTKTGALSNGTFYGGAFGATALNLTDTTYGLFAAGNGGTINWAGYFGNGNVYIQDTLVFAKEYVRVPFYTSGKILTSDGTGYASWQTPAAVSAWSPNGNSATNSATNFIGTTDNVSLNIRTGNSNRMIIDSLGRVGIGTISPSELLNVVLNTDADKHTIYGHASQLTTASDYQNVGVAGFATGLANAYGFGSGIMGIANPSVSGGAGLYGSFGVYAGLNSSLPTIGIGNTHYAFYADAGTASITKYAGAFMNGNVGIGTNTPAQALDVYSKFQVDANGNVVKLNNVTTSFPAANAAGFLSNDASGNLSWSTSGILSGGTANYLARWTGANTLGLSALQDDGTYVGLGIAPNSSVKFNLLESGSAMAYQISQTGTGSGMFLYLSNAANAGYGLQVRTDGTGNAGEFQIVNASNSSPALTSSTNGSGNAIYGANSGTGSAAYFSNTNSGSSSNAVTISTNGSNSTGLAVQHSGTSGAGTDYGVYVTNTGVSASTANVGGYFSASGASNNYALVVPSGGGNVGIGTATPVSLFSTGSASQFQVDANGNIIKLNNVTTSFPAANSAGVLSNNGTGTLSWASNISIAPIQTASNGLTVAANNVTLGGALTGATSITSATAASNLTVSNSAITNGSTMVVSSTSTAGTAGGASTVFSITRTGANTNTTHTAYGIKSDVANTGTSSTNVAGYFRAGSGTNNYSIIVPASGGTVGIGTSAPSSASLLHVVGSGNGSTVNLEDNSITNGSLLYMSSTATTGTASNSSTMINIARSGANANTAHTAYGVKASITNTNATSGTNVGGYFSASGATTGNYALIVPPSGGSVGIGTTTPDAGTSLLTISSSATTTYASLKAHGSTSATIPNLGLSRARGTESAKTIVSAGDMLGKLSFAGYDGTDFYPAASITAAVDATPGATDMPGNLQFNTSADGSAAPTTRMVILNTGFVGVGTTAPTSTLDVNGSVSYATRTVSTSTTLGATDCFLILSSATNPVVTLPAANTCAGRVYIIKVMASTSGATTSITFLNVSGTAVSALTGPNIYNLISDGTNWQQW